MTVLLAIVFCGYFVLAGLDYGVALVAAGRSDLDRIAPFFLGNEVWLVAAVGLLFGAFPADEGILLGAYRVPAALALIGVVIVTAAFGLRIFAQQSRAAAGPGEPKPAAVAPVGVAAGSVAPVGIGARTVAPVGVTADSAAPGPGASGGVAAGGGVGALDGVARIGGALAALGWGAVLGAVWHGGHFEISAPVIVGALGMLALVGLHGWAFLRRRWAVLAGTTAVLIGSVAAVGSTITWHPASSTPVNLVAPVAYAVVPLVIVLQATTWWMFRRRHLSEPSAATGTASA